MSKNYYSKQTAIEMAFEALEIFAQSGIDARFSTDIMIDETRDTGEEYYLHVYIKAADATETDGGEAFYPKSYDLSEVRERIEEIKERQNRQPADSDTDLLRRMFPNSPMADIDRLLGIVKGWKKEGGQNER